MRSKRRHGQYIVRTIHHGGMQAREKGQDGVETRMDITLNTV